MSERSELIEDFSGLGLGAGRRSSVVNDVVGLLLLVHHGELKAFPSPEFPGTPTPGAHAPGAKGPRRGDEHDLVAQGIRSRLEEQSRVEDHPAAGFCDPAANPIRKKSPADQKAFMGPLYR